MRISEKEIQMGVQDAERIQRVSTKMVLSMEYEEYYIFMLWNRREITKLGCETVEKREI